MPLVTRRRIAAILAALLVGAGSAACTGAPPVVTASPTAAPRPPSPAERLTLALALAKGMNCDLTVTQPGQDSVATGSVNYATQSATVSLQEPRRRTPIVSIEAVEVGSKLWVKIDFGAANARLGLNAKKWYLVDQTKLTGARKKLFDVANYDVLDIAGLMASTSDLVGKDAAHITGMVDLTRSTGVSAPTPTDLAKAGPGAAKVPFSATVDGQGRLIDLVIQADAVDRDLTNEYAFSNLGAPGPVDRAGRRRCRPDPDRGLPDLQRALTAGRGDDPDICPEGSHSSLGRRSV